MFKILLCFAFVLGLGVIEAFVTTLRQTENELNIIPLIVSDETVGGDKVDIKQFPYQVLLLYKRMPFCGGSIISDRYVLTAAHCMVDLSPQIFAFRIGSTFASKGGEIYGCSSIKVHPNYNPNFDYDIAVLKSSKTFALNGVTTKAVQLADSKSGLSPGDNIIVSGWGKTQEDGPLSEVLRAVTVPVIARGHCIHAYPLLTYRMLCAGLKKGGKDSCQGDSGGPAVDKNLVQYGIVSHGLGCARPDKPGVYTYIPLVRDWITEVSGV